MGLFSKKKKIYVSSTLYNMAGPIEDRVQFLPTTINTKILSHSEESIGSTIVRSLLNGPGMRIRSYARWCRTSGYTQAIGLSIGQIFINDNIDHGVIIDSIPTPPEMQVAIQTAEISIADYGYWVDEWMLANHPTEVAEDYEIDFNEELNIVYITFASDGRVYTFSPQNFDYNEMYLYVSYVFVGKNIIQPLVPGTPVVVDDEDDLPNTNTWKLNSSSSTPVSMSLEDTVVTTVSYSDGRPDEVTEEINPHTETGNNLEGEWEKTFYNGNTPDMSGTSSTRRVVTKYRKAIMKESTSTTTEEETLPDLVVKTTTVVTTVQEAAWEYSYVEDTQEILNDTTSTMKMIIYKKGDGNAAFDEMFAPAENAGGFVPFIPVRNGGRMIETGSLIPWLKKATKKAFDKKYDFLLKQIKATPQLREIDYAYCVFAVSLNTKENACRKYLYLFFQLLNTVGAGGDAAYIKWEQDWLEAERKQATWQRWKDAQSNPLSPLYDTPEPPRAVYPAQPLRTLRQKAGGLGYNMSVRYGGIRESVIPGRVPNRKVGEVWFVLGAQADYREALLSAGITDDRTLSSDTLFMWFQDKADSHRVLTVTGMHHNYIIYKGKGVDIKVREAMRDSDESGFLIPLHEGVFRAMNLKDATQMATACSYMVLNSYKVVKKKWYASSWFKVVLIIVVIVITIFTWGAGGAAAGGVLGTNAAVGASIGLAGTAAIVAGAAINAIAGIIIGQIIMAASAKLIGGTAGAIIGAIAAVATVSAASSVATGGTAMQGLTNMSSAMNLMKVSVATANSYAEVMKGQIDDIATEIEDLQKAFTEKMTEIYTAWTQNLGFNKGTIDIQALTESARKEFYKENLETFLSRTLMTGSDIADTTNGLIGAFPSATTSTYLP